jgi:predicted lipase
MQEKFLNICILEKKVLTIKGAISLLCGHSGEYSLPVLFQAN